MKRQGQGVPLTPSDTPFQRDRSVAIPNPRDAEPVQLDPRVSARFVEEIRGISLTDDLVEAVDGYEEVGQRNVFLWRWVRRGLEITTLSSLDENYRDHVLDTKTLGVMFDVLVDDVADESDDRVFLEKLVGITEGRVEYLGDLSTEQRRYYTFTRGIWSSIWERIRTYPRFGEFEDILVYDYRQLMNSMRYSMLIRENPAIMNLVEHDSYLPHNMHMMVSGTIDLMASPGFEIGELCRLRTVLTHAQHMGRIGNLVTTWEREIREKDYSSGVFALALASGVLTLADLEEGDQERIGRRIRAADLERQFLLRWQDRRRKIAGLRDRVETVDVGKLLEGLDTLMQLHLGSRGLK